MTVLYILLGFLAALLVLAVVLVAPVPTKTIGKYRGVRFAHRGLHSEGVAENSMSAFVAARDAGFGIELDVRLSSDGELVVFHDDTLDRVAGVSGRVDEFTADQLAEMRLSGTEDGVPRFSEVLAAIDGRVPLLVEIKEDAGNSRVSEKTAEMLAGYGGEYIVESFNPLSLGTVKICLISFRAKIRLSRLHFRFLNGKNIGVDCMKTLGKALRQHGTKAVDIP